MYLPTTEAKVTLSRMLLKADFSLASGSGSVQLGNHVHELGNNLAELLQNFSELGNNLVEFKR